MPLTSEDMYSTEKNGTINTDYCKWCYKDGEFVEKTRALSSNGEPGGTRFVERCPVFWTIPSGIGEGRPCFALHSSLILNPIFT
ncbi:zinc ribbon domain-containing protein [Candidatus Saccharibacteria bacterium]|nr:zinc ribbon domain-containing protein [Candidatus Saccharibacteria bacterium]